MPTYEDLQTELLEISKIVEKFPEQVKPQVYDLLVTEFLGKKQQLTPLTRTQQRTKKETAKEPAKTPRVRKAVAKESYSIDRDLNLIRDKSILSFREFQKEKKPKSTNDFNAVAVYYLKKIAGLQQVTLDHAYTCYAEVSRKPLQHFRQSFIDTKNKKGWVKFDDAGNLDIPHRGVVYVEHDLPKAKKEKKK